VRLQRITVDPITDKIQIKKLKKTGDYPRDYLLFVMGTNKGLRISDILKLKVGDVRRLGVVEHLIITEQNNP
jgi:hypothetical protein